MSAISFNQIIENLVSDAFASVTATRVALAAHRDLYHFQMAIHEYGEQAVVMECARVLQQRYRCTFAEAATDAGNRVRACLEQVAGQNTFQTVRDNLRAQDEQS